MSVRQAIAQRYASVPSAKVFRLKGHLAPQTTDVSRSLLFRPRVSQDALRSLAVPDSHNLSAGVSLTAPSTRLRSHSVGIPETEDWTDVIRTIVIVSEDLLSPIGRSPTKGKDYTAVESQTTLSGLSRTEQIVGSDAAGPGDIVTRTRQAVVRKTLGLWDMILPLLKPPIDFDFPTQLDFPSELYPFQVIGVQWLVESESSLLADEMGTGKTVMATVALRILFHKGLARKALVLCPASVLSVWEKHLRDWGGGALAFSVVHGRQDVRQRKWTYPSHVYVTTYDTFRNDALGSERHGLDLGSFDVVILDEVHHIRNPSAKRSTAVRRLSPKYRWALSGVPLQNKLEDLEGIFRFVKPGLLHRDSLTSGSVKRAIEPHFLRRLKADVLDELPAKTREDILLEMDAEQRRAYDETLGRAKARFNSTQTPFTGMHVFALIQRLKQIANFAPGKTTSPKLECLLEQLEEIFQEDNKRIVDNKAVVFTQYVGEGVEKLRQHLEHYGVVEIIGQTTQLRRKNAVEAFQRDPNVRIFLASTKAAGEGITLTQGNYVFHFDHWWNPAVGWNAEDRVHRPGQTKAVNIYQYWMKDSIEERIWDILRRKGLLHEEVINAMSESEIDQSVTMEEWCEVLGLDANVVLKQGVVKVREQPVTVGEVYQTLSEISPYMFEQIVVEVLQGMGYVDARLCGQAYDGGIDIRASRKVLGGLEHIAFQCKRKNVVGVDVARELLGTIAADPSLTKGILVVSGKLSLPCREFVRQNGSLATIEGIELAKKVRDLGLCDRLAELAG